MALTDAQIKEFEEVEAKAKKFSDLLAVADDLTEAGDKDWAKKVFKKAEDKANSIYNFIRLGEDLCEKLGDKEWAKKVYRKAEDMVGSSSDTKNLADSLCDHLGDEEWAIEVYEKQSRKKEVIENVDYLIHSYKKKNVVLTDAQIKEFKKLEVEAESFKHFASTVEAESLGDFCNVANNLAEAGDKDWAKSVYQKALELAEKIKDVEIYKEIEQKIIALDQYKVIFLNDNATPMGFVAEMLVQIFKYSYPVAHDVTMKIHEEASAIVGAYSWEIAEHKRVEVTNLSRSQGFPLQIIVE